MFRSSGSILFELC